jgi:hypothetical protein
VTAVAAASGTHDHAFVIVFGLFLVLSLTLGFFVVRFAVTLRRDRPGRAPRRTGRRP